MGIRLAHNLVTSNVMDFIELSPDYSVFEVLASPKFINKTLGELNLRAALGISVMAIKRDEQIIVAPGADALIKERDVLVLVGKNNALAKLPN